MPDSCHEGRIRRQKYATGAAAISPAAELIFPHLALFSQQPTAEVLGGANFPKKFARSRMGFGVAVVTFESD
jgi:hypothetical protein